MQSGGPTGTMYSWSASPTTANAGMVGLVSLGPPYFRHLRKSRMAIYTISLSPRGSYGLSHKSGQCDFPGWFAVRTIDAWWLIRQLGFSEDQIERDETSAGRSRMKRKWSPTAGRGKHVLAMASRQYRTDTATCGRTNARWPPRWWKGSARSVRPACSARPW